MSPLKRQASLMVRSETSNEETKKYKKKLNEIEKDGERERDLIYSKRVREGGRVQVDYL